MKLYEIIKDLDQWYFENDEFSAVTSEAAIVKLDALNLAYDQKIGALGRIYRNLQSESEVLAAEEKRLKEKRLGVDGRLENLRWFIGRMLGEGKRWSDGVISFAWRRSESVEVDEPFLPPDWWREKIYREPDKTKIKDALKSGQQIVGAALIEKNNLQIK